MKAHQWIDRVKVARGWDSDYRVAQELGLSRAAVSHYRNGLRTLDEESSARLAVALGERPEAVILDQVKKEHRPAANDPFAKPPPGVEVLPIVKERDGARCDDLAPMGASAFLALAEPALAVAGRGALLACHGVPFSDPRECPRRCE